MADLPGSAYLYASATVSIILAGFSALVMTVRQGLGGPGARYDAVAFRTIVELGLIVAAGALLPPLLALCDLPPPQIWQIASLAVAAPILCFVATFSSRRYRATLRRPPFTVRLLLIPQAFAALLLFANAAGKSFAPGAGPFAVGLSLLLFSAGCVFLQALALLLHPGGSPEG